jgi:kynurenine formamidase
VHAGAALRELLHELPLPGELVPPHAPSIPARRRASRAVALASVALAGAACGGAAPLAGRVVDLTHAFDETAVYWPTGEGFAITVLADGPTEGGYTYRANSFCAAEHGGTHLDAPSHFSERGQTSDEIPPERFVGPGVVVDVAARCTADPDCLVGIADLRSHEARRGRIPDGAIVLLRTGYGARWADRAAYLGTAERGAEAVAKLRFPGLDPEAARFLAEERRIDAVGIDTASIDPGRSTEFPAHRVLAERNVPVLENVAHLEQLPEAPFTVVALPMKIGGGSGGPLRIVAILHPGR